MGVPLVPDPKSLATASPETIRPILQHFIAEIRAERNEKEIVGSVTYYCPPPFDIAPMAEMLPIISASMVEQGKPEDNGYAERLMRTIKEEAVDLSDYEDFHDNSSSGSQHGNACQAKGLPRAISGFQNIG